jgi:hypothetical protein
MPPADEEQGPQTADPRYTKSVIGNSSIAANRCQGNSFTVGEQFAQTVGLLSEVIGDAG